MKIRTGGRPSLYTISRGLVKKSCLTLATIRRARTETGSSGRKTQKFVSIIRKELGPGVVEPGLAAEMTKMNHVFDGHFEVDAVE